MFHQFRVKPEHQAFLRFLWWEDEDFTQPPVDFRMKVHLFGAVSSPACANFGLKQLAKDYKHLGVNASEFLKNNFYVDHGLKSEQSVEAMKDLIHNAVEICEKGNLRLHKISCNNSEVMLSLPESERAIVTQTDLEPSQKSFSPEKGF
ncbi:uncharacterized protein LOC102805690, partial [Saccoglossus kowalevskii]|uniref:Uncharacterized protein LOC102805690 n=1 Tax=Saccoglossus kowalevskii TaxID=10224 RepID=A0ABM0MBH0_SACKO